MKSRLYRRHPLNRHLGRARSDRFDRDFMVKNQLPSMTSKRSHHLIKLLMLIDVSIQQRLSLQRCQRLKLYFILWLIKKLSDWKMVRRICEITVTLDFIFRLVLCSHEDVSPSIIFLNVLEGIIQINLSVWLKKTRLETPFKGANVKAFIKTSNCEKLVLYFSEKVQKIAAFAAFFWFRLKMFWLPPMIRNTHVTR